MQYFLKADVNTIVRSTICIITNTRLLEVKSDTAASPLLANLSTINMHLAIHVYGHCL